MSDTADSINRIADLGVQAVDIGRQLLAEKREIQDQLTALTRQLAERGWQPIESAPKDRPVFFWLVPKVLGDEGVYANSSGDPILSSHPPYRKFTRWGGWSALSKATHWMEDIQPPEPAGEGDHIIAAKANPDIC